MRYHKRISCSILCFLFTTTASADVHEAVRAAVNWELPTNECTKPKSIVSHPSVTANGGSYVHAPSGTTEESVGTTISDVDHYQVARYERKRKRWETCVSEYKSELLEHFSALKDSAQHGLTKAQADTIMGHLSLIQNVVMTPDGQLTEE